MKQTSKQITFSDAAEQLGCSRQYVHQMVRKLGIEPRKVSTRLNMLSKQDVLKIKRHMNKKE